MAGKVPRGTILLIARVPEENGANPKDRPVVLVRDFLDTDALAYGVGVTGTFPQPIPPTSVGLPFHRQGNCATGLTKKCTTCIFAVQAAWRWLAYYEIWHETGEWPLPEAK